MSNNLRHQLLNLLLIATTNIINPSVIFAQNEINNVSCKLAFNRIAQLERITNTYGQLLTQLQKELSENQSDIDSLRGYIQNNQYRLDQILERQKQISLEIESIHNSINKLKKNLDEQNASSLRGVVEDKDASNDYNVAIALIKNKLHQDEAITLFQNFMKKYPDSIYQPNANYWLGQLNYNKGKRDDAAYYFASVVKKYPKSQKAPEAMYKVGLIMQDKGDIDKAKATYQLVMIRYPGSDSAKRAEKSLSLLTSK